MGFRANFFIILILNFFSIPYSSIEESFNGTAKKINTYATYNQTNYFIFKKLNKDSYKIINNDYFECVSEAKNFTLMSNSENKTYLNLKTNNRFYVELNWKTIKEREIQIVIKGNEINYLYVEGTKERPICIYLFYSKTEILEFEKDTEYTFKVFDHLYYYFYLINLEEKKGITLRIEPKNDSTDYSMNLEGANENYIFKEDFYHNKIKLIPKNKTIKVKLSVTNYRAVDEFTIDFYDYVNKVEEFKILYIIAIVFGSLCFAILAIFLLNLYINCSSGIECSKDFDYFKEKILSVYLCQKYDFLNKRKYLKYLKSKGYLIHLHNTHKI